MTNWLRSSFLAANVMFGMAGAPARASDPLGFYVGAAVGRATVRDNETVLDNPLQFSQSDAAWKVLLGLRPIPLLGVEIDYIDFGHPSVHSISFPADVQAKAPALFGVLYAPLPLPLLDLYAKAGVARLQTTVNTAELFEGAACNPQPCRGTAYPTSFHGEQTGGHFAYGAGAQVKLSSFAIRAEYERIDDSDGSPDIVSLGLAWSF